MMDIVDETLKEWRSTPHQYGVSDCVVSVGRYFMKLGALKDVPAHHGTYSTNAEAMHLIDELGGMGAVMNIIGGTEVDGDPQRGDIACLVAYGHPYPIPALCTGDGAAIKLETGIVEVKLRFVKWASVWRGVPK